VPRTGSVSQVAPWWRQAGLTLYSLGSRKEIPGLRTIFWWMAALSDKPPADTLSIAVTPCSGPSRPQITALPASERNRDPGGQALQIFRVMCLLPPDCADQPPG